MKMLPLALLLIAGAAYAQPGSFDLNFNGNGKVLASFFYDFGSGPEIGGQDYGAELAVQPDGKIIVAGRTYNGSNEDLGLMRFNTNGSLDNSFGFGGRISYNLGNNERAVAVTVQPDGKILVAVLAEGRLNGSDFAVVRLHADGTSDDGFGDNAVAYIDFGDVDVPTSIVLQSDGKIIIAGFAAVPGNDVDFALARLNDNGTPDNGFGTNGRVTTFISTAGDYLNAITLQSDGKILAAGQSNISLSTDFAVVRYNIDGSPDNSFDGDGMVISSLGPTEDARDIIVQSDGKIIVAGYAHVSVNNDFAVLRLNADGSPDNSFDGDGKATASIVNGTDFGMSVALQPDGKIIVAGYSLNGPFHDFSLVRFNANGSLDNSFDGDGKAINDIAGDDYCHAVKVHGNRIYTAGYTFDLSDGYYKFSLAAFQVSSNLPLTLMGFNAHVQPGSVLLRWKTSSEHNTAQFIIERSHDGVNFLPAATVTASGNSSSVKNYSFNDQYPLYGTRWYRLKMMDADGRFKYSGVVIVNVKAGGELLIFPNPVKAVLHVQAKGKGNATVSITDATGKIVKTQTVQLEGITAFAMDVQSLAKGQYYLVLKLKDGRKAQAFIKQ